MGDFRGVQRNAEHIYYSLELHTQIRKVMDYYY